MDNITFTWKFKDVIPDYDSFIQLFDEYRPAATGATEDDMRFIYRLIYNEYADRTVAFCERCTFYRRFYNILWNELEYFLKKLKIIQYIRNLDYSDMLVEYETIANVANNDNRIVESPLREIIPYITTQTSSTSKGNILSKLIEASQAYETNVSEYFLVVFEKLFIDIYPDYVVYYQREED